MNDSTERETIEDAIAAYLTDECGVRPDFLHSDRRLFTDGALDSIQIVGLVAFLEERFDIVVQPFEISIEHFDSWPKLASFVRAKRSPRSG